MVKWDWEVSGSSNLQWSKSQEEGPCVTLTEKTTELQSSPVPLRVPSQRGSAFEVFRRYWVGRIEGDRTPGKLDSYHGRAGDQGLYSDYTSSRNGVRITCILLFLFICPRPLQTNTWYWVGEDGTDMYVMYPGQDPNIE